MSVGRLVSRTPAAEEVDSLDLDLDGRIVKVMTVGGEGQWACSSAAEQNCLSPLMYDFEPLKAWWESIV